jgi:hypothetical protein
MLIAIYVPTLHIDLDGNNNVDKNTGEAYVAVSKYYVVYISGPVPSQYASSGYQDGWNGLDYSTHPPSVVSLTNVPIDVTLSPVTSYNIGGASTVTGMNMTLLPHIAAGGKNVLTYYGDGALPANWSIQVSSYPAMDHLETLPSFGGVDGSIEIPIAYTDDGTGSYNYGDTINNGACSSGKQVYLVYLLLDDLVSTINYMGSGITMPPGWSLVTDPFSAPQPVPAGNAINLSFDSSCPAVIQ